MPLLIYYVFVKAYWRGYRIRKSLEHRKKLLVKHEELKRRKRTIKYSDKKEYTRKSKVYNQGLTRKLSVP